MRCSRRYDQMTCFFSLGAEESVGLVFSMVCIFWLRGHGLVHRTNWNGNRKGDTTYSSISSITMGTTVGGRGT